MLASLLPFSPVVLEMKIDIWSLQTDGQQVIAIPHMDFCSRQVKKTLIMAGKQLIVESQCNINIVYNEITWFIEKQIYM